MCLWDMKATPTLISQYYYPFILSSVIPAIFYQFVPYSGNTNIQSEIMFDCLVQIVSCSFFIFVSLFLSLFVSMSLLHSSKWWFTQKPYEDETFNVSGGFSCCSNFQSYMKSLIRRNLVPFNQTNPNKGNTVSKYQFEEEKNNNNNTFIENRTAKLLMFIFLCTNMLFSCS